MEFKSSQTCQNLMKAFAGESQARNRYSYYASIARKAGYHQIADIFIETADNEKEHAKMFMKQLIKHGMNEQVVVINDAGYPVALDDTLKNLGFAAAGEKEEWTILYKNFAEIAEKEGYPEAAKTFKQIGLVEKRHEARYNKLMENVKSGKVFKKDGKAQWICRNCGHIIDASEAPKMCPVCDHGQEYFQMFVENY
jgi:rubrerythrin